MADLIPYLMGLLGFLVINKDRSNRIVTVLFGFSYSASLLIREYVPEEPNIYIVEIGLTTAFFVALVACVKHMDLKITMMIMVLVVSDITLTLMDIVAYLAYPIKATNGAYDLVYESYEPIIIMQYAALWVSDARRVNLRTYYDNIALYCRDIAMRVFYR